MMVFSKHDATSAKRGEMGVDAFGRKMLETEKAARSVAISQKERWKKTRRGNASPEREKISTTPKDAG